MAAHIKSLIKFRGNYLGFFMLPPFSIHVLKQLALIAGLLALMLLSLFTLAVYFFTLQNFLYSFLIWSVTDYFMVRRTIRYYKNRK